MVLKHLWGFPERINCWGYKCRRALRMTKRVVWSCHTYCGANLTMGAIGNGRGSRAVDGSVTLLLYCEILCRTAATAVAVTPHTRGRLLCLSGLPLLVTWFSHDPIHKVCTTSTPYSFSRAAIISCFILPHCTLLLDTIFFFVFCYLKQYETTGCFVFYRLICKSVSREKKTKIPNLTNYLYLLTKQKKSTVAKGVVCVIYCTRIIPSNDADVAIFDSQLKEKFGFTIKHWALT